MFGPVAMAYNVEGVDKLVVNGDVLAKIFQGQIKKWNDPAIAALNSGATLPDADIKPIYRSDSSGTTDNFQKYLGAAAPAVVDQGCRQGVPGRRRRGRAEVGRCRAGRSRPPPARSATSRRASPQQAGLKFAQIDSGGGRRRAHRRVDRRRPSTAAKFKADGKDLALDLNALYATKEAGAYPLMLATYEIVCSKGYDADTAAAVKSFLTVVRQPGSGQPVGGRLRPAARRLQGASAEVRRRNCVVT